MIERFDHAVIGVPDLDAGMEAFRRLGFEVAAGGRHPSLGTRNAIVRFRLDYLELLAVDDPVAARARGSFGRDLLAFLERDSGLVGFVLAGANLEHEANGLRSLGLVVEGPFEMDRIHPAGGRLRWRLVLPGGSPWRKPWPYLIDWITAEDELLDRDPPGRHGCRVAGVAGIDLVVDDLAAAGPLYGQALGLERAGRCIRVPTGRRYRIGSFRLGLHRPAGTGAMATELHRRGPGPFRLILSSGDIEATAAEMDRNGIATDRTPEGIDIDPAEAMGARLRIVPR